MIVSGTFRVCARHPYRRLADCRVTAVVADGGGDAAEGVAGGRRRCQMLPNAVPRCCAGCRGSFVHWQHDRSGERMTSTSQVKVSCHRRAFELNTLSDQLRVQFS